MWKKASRKMSFDEKFKDALAFYHKAEDALKDGDFDISLFQIRKALENIVRHMCERYAIDVKDPATGKPVDLINLIDLLGSNSIISEADVHLLHQIRSLGNKGVHSNDVPPTRWQAQTAINKFSQALAIFKRIEAKETEKAARAKYNDSANKPAKARKFASKKILKWFTFIIVIALLVLFVRICFEAGCVGTATIAEVEDFIYSKSSQLIAAIDNRFDIDSIESVDPFSYVNLEVSGLSSKANAQIKLVKQHDYFNNSEMYKLNRATGLSNGDTIRISLTSNALHDALKKGYIITQLEQDYVVTGLPEAVRVLSDIPTKFLELFKSKCEMQFWECIDQKALSSNGMNINLDYMGLYFYANTSQKWAEDNALYIVYQANVTQDGSSEASFDEFSYYYCAVYENITNTSGIINGTEVKWVNPSFNHEDINYSGYKSLDELYQTTPLNCSKGMKYRCEASPADETVVYTGRLPAPYYPKTVNDIPEHLLSEMEQTAQKKIEAYVATWKYPKTYRDAECVDIRTATPFGSGGNTIILLYKIELHPLIRTDDLGEFYYFVAFKDVYKTGYESWNTLSAPLTPKNSFMHDIYGVGFMEFLTYNGYETLDKFEVAFQAYKTGKLKEASFLS